MGAYSAFSDEDLLHHCVESGNVDAWKEFVRRYQPLIAAIVFRISSRYGTSARHLVDDLIQETYVKLCANQFRVLRDFEQRDCGSFFGYLKVTAANVVHDHFKSSEALKRGAGKEADIVIDECPAAAPEPTVLGLKSVERSVLLGEIQRHLEICTNGPEQHRNSRIFWLYYRVGLPASAIAELPGIDLSVKGVESTINRLTKDLRKRLADPPKFNSTHIQDATEGVVSPESL